MTIIELKRPMRDGYKEGDDEKDPIEQVKRYVRQLRSNKVKDRTGQYIRLNERTQFYAFIVCTLTPTMDEIAKGHDCTQTPDGQGYYYFHETWNLYAEIVSYDKMISDARKRNQILFDKLNLPPQRVR